MRAFLQLVSTISIAGAGSLMLGILGISLPMMGVGSQGLGYFLTGIAALLFIICIVGLLLKAYFWIKGVLAEREQLRIQLKSTRTDLEKANHEHEQPRDKLRQNKQEYEQLRSRLQQADQEREELTVNLQTLKDELDALRSRDPDAEWNNTVKVPVVGNSYRNERVELDGFSYSNCTFVNVTFVYKGKRPYDLAGNTIRGCYVDAASAPLHGLIVLLYHLHMLNPEMDMSDLHAVLGTPSEIKAEDQKEPDA